MDRRGQYGASRVGQLAPSTVYVERKTSFIPPIIGALAVIGGALWSRHQAQQIEQLYKKTGLPHQSFASSLKQDASASLRGIADLFRPKRRGERAQ